VSRQPASQAEEQFVVDCLRARWAEGALDAARAAAVAGDVDWAVVGEIAARELVAPLVYGQVRAAGVVPEEIVRHWRQLRDRTVLVNGMMRRELEDALSALDDHDLPVILLKGAALLTTLYGWDAGRPMCDIDILVRTGDRDASIGALVARGYQRTDVETVPGAAAQFENEVMLTRPGLVATALELHWSLFDSPYYQFRVPLDWFWGSTEPCALGSARALVLQPEAQLLHLCGHLVLHHGGRGLLWFHDVAELIARRGERIDWRIVTERSAELDLVLALRDVLRRVARQWQVAVPDEAIARLDALAPTPGERRVHGWLTAETRPAGRRFRSDLLTLPSWADRLRFARANVLPSAAYMRDRYRIGHGALLPAFYVYRWLSGLRDLVVPTRLRRRIAR
jgi:hypothetical protein